MSKLESLPERFFNRFILANPGQVVILLLLIVFFLGIHARNFKLDASAETLVLENDEDLKYSRLIHKRYGTEDYLIITFAPHGDLFSGKNLKILALLRDELKQLDRVTAVNSILDVPLLESPPVPIKKLASNVQTLESPSVNKALARKEFQNSPVYQNLLVSPDLKTTALQVMFENDETYYELLYRRNELNEKQETGSLSPEEAHELADVKKRFSNHRDKMRDIRHQDIAKIRSMMNKYRTDTVLFLGGISMIADDLISFIKNDLKLFGLGVLFFLIVTLSFIFRRPRWILLPILCCGFSAVCMMGLLGIFNWEVTVISSNFISLQLIITMAITIHLIVRYRELHAENPDHDHKTLTLGAVTLMLKPCLYAGLTTIAGFGSLVLCDILPVRTFGLMMIAGIIVSLIMTFLFFPASIMLVQKEKTVGTVKTIFPLTSVLARLTERHGILIMILSGAALIISGIGITKLEVENCFIDYFKKTTEIYQGMKVIDQNLGGTTPLDVVIKIEGHNTAAPVSDETDDGGDEFDDFGDFTEFDNAETEDKYWFTSDKMEQVKRIHNYLDSLPETGKVLSLGTMLKVAEKLNDNKPLDNFKLALLYSEIPDKFKELVLKPYVSVEHNEVRYSIRIIDSEKSLRRNAFLKKVNSDLVTKLGLKQENVRLTGMLVLYNNMLQSLFSSQIMTLGIVLAALLLMFLVLFRSFKIAIIAIFPNLLSILVVLGVMGWLKIPLDMMTITIAAISVGIAVDDTIHYIHRFMREFETDRQYLPAMHRCHGTIGHAMYYTSLTIIIGFSILVLSNFIPSIYFGILTGLAMFIALVAALTLLPQLIVFFKPLGPEN